MAAGGRRRAGVGGGVAGGRRRRCAGLGRCGGCGGGDGIAPRGQMVDEVEGERLRKGHQLRTMGGGGRGSPIRPRWAGAEIIMVAALSHLLPNLFYTSISTVSTYEVPR